MRDSYDEPIYKNGFFQIGIIIMIIVGIIVCWSLFIGGPESQAHWNELKSQIDSMSCEELKELIIKSSIDYSENGHTPEYNYAYAKFNVGTCK